MSCMTRGRSTRATIAIAAAWRVPSIHLTSFCKVRSHLLTMSTSRGATSTGVRCAATAGGTRCGGGGGWSFRWMVFAASTAATHAPVSRRLTKIWRNRCSTSSLRDVSESSCRSCSREVRYAHTFSRTRPKRVHVWCSTSSSSMSPPAGGQPFAARPPAVSTKPSENINALRAYCAPSRHTGQHSTTRHPDRIVTSVPHSCGFGMR